MTAIIAFFVTTAIVGPTSLLFGILLERDRVARFPTVADRLPVARLTRRQRKAWTQWRRDRWAP